MLRKLLITLVLAGMLFFWGCSSGGGKSGSSDDPGGDNHTTIPDSSGNVDDILPLSNKYVVLSKDSVSLYVGESVDIAILKNEYALELSVSVDDEFVADAEINGDIVTVKATGDGDACIYLNYIDDDSNFKRAADINITAILRSSEFYPLVSSIEYTGQGAGEMTINGQYVYIYDDGDPPNNKIHIVDISDVTNPILINSFAVDAELEILSMEVANGMIYVCAEVPNAYSGYERNGIRIIDVRDPNSPTVVGEYLTENVPFYYYSGAGDLEYQNSRLYLSSRNGIEVLDVSDPSSPKQMGYYENSSTGYKTNEYYIWGFAVEGNFAYLGYILSSEDKSAFNILDISDPQNISMASSTNINDFPNTGIAGVHYIYVSGKYAYAYALGGGINILNIESPYNPGIVSQITDFDDLSISSGDILEDNGFIFTCRSGFMILSVADHEKPLCVASGGIIQSSMRLEIYGDYLFVSSSKTFAIYNISFFTNYSH